MIGMDLNRFILEEERKYPQATGSLSRALMAIEAATKIIVSHVRMAGLADVLGRAGSRNVHGEEVQKLDLLAHEILMEQLADSGEFYALASEELDTVHFPQKGRHGKYIIALDPLDGSSNIDVNVSIGTIFSIYRKQKGDATDFLQGGKHQVAAGYVVYGSSTMFLLTTGNGVNGFTLDPAVGLFLLSHPQIRMPERGRIYSVNEANAPRWRPQTLQGYVEQLKQRGYTARYIGSMVADVHRTLIKGGLFAYPADDKNPQGKLRYLYEAAPMAMLVEQAGGRSSWGGGSLLEWQPQEIHQRVPVFLGSRQEIAELESVGAA